MKDKKVNLTKEQKDKRKDLKIALIIILIFVSFIALIVIMISRMDRVSKARKNIKKNNSEIEARYIAIVENLYKRAVKQDYTGYKHEQYPVEGDNDFINRMIRDKYLDIGTELGKDHYDRNFVYIGRLEGGNFKHIVNISNPDVNIADMVLKIRTTKKNENVYIPFGNFDDITVNWGETSNSDFQKFSNESGLSFTYENPNDYIVKIRGKAPEYSSFGEEATFQGYAFKQKNPNIVGLLNWGENGIHKFATFGNSIEGSIPQPTKRSFENTYSFGYTFFGCENITGEIPSNLFDNAPRLEYISGMFSGCKNLTGSIPENLFYKLPEVRAFDYFFSNCENLTGSIPENLFIYNTKASSFIRVFSNCKNLTGNIPENLFKYSRSAINFEATFAHCAGLTGSIPEKLFENCPNAMGFSMTFMYCSGLTGEIPTSLFYNNNGKDFFATFAECTGLTEAVSSDLFRNAQDGARFDAVFEGSINISNYRILPENWKTNTSNMRYKK